MWIKVSILDVEKIQQIGRELIELGEAASEEKKILVSFKDARYLTSTSIDTLLQLNKKAKLCGVQLALRDMNPNVLEVFKVTRLDKVFHILDERERDDDDDDDKPGGAGSFAKLPKRPGSGGNSAKPRREEP